MTKPWWQYLLDMLTGAMIKDQLTQAGAGPDALSAAITGSLDLPTFAADNPGPPAQPESRDLAHCHAELRRRYAAVKADFEAQTGRQLFETCTWRSSAKQQDLYRIGRRGIPGEKIVTKIDGVTSRSRHGVYPSEAVDVCVDSDPGPGKHAVWDEAAYAPLGPLADAHGLIWGGRWGIHDYPHLQLPNDVI